MLGAEQLAGELPFPAFGLEILIWCPDVWLRPGRVMSGLSACRKILIVANCQPHLPQQSIRDAAPLLSCRPPQIPPVPCWCLPCTLLLTFVLQ